MSVMTRRSTLLPPQWPLLLLLLQLAAPLCLRSVLGGCPPGSYNDGYLSVPTNTGGFEQPTTSLNFNLQPFTVEAWVRRAAGSGTQDRWFFSAGKTTDANAAKQYLHLGVRGATSSNKIAFGFWGTGNDLESPSGAAAGVTDNTFPVSETAALNWGGDIDELYVFTIPLDATTVAAHFAGNFYGVTNVALWLRFSEGTGTTTADSSPNAITLVDGTGSIWRSGETGTGRCHPAYWLSYRVERKSDASLPIGAQSFFTVHQADNWGNAVTSSMTAPPTTITVKPIGSGSWLAATPAITLSLSGTTGAAFTYSDNLAETVSIQVIDSAPNGHPVVPPTATVPTLTVVSSTQTWTAASVAGVVLVPPAGSEAVTYSPALQPLGLAYSTSVRAITSSLALLVTLSTGGTASYAVNGVDMGALTSGQTTNSFLLPEPVLTNGFGVPCGLRSSLLAWLPLSYGVTADHSGRGMYIEVEVAAGLGSIVDRFNVANSALQFNGISSLRPVVALPTDRFAISVWFRNGDPGNLAMLSTSSTAVAGFNRLYMNAGVIGCRLSGQESLAVPGTWNDGVWHHLVWQLSASAPVLGQQIWIDGLVRAQGMRTSSSISPQDIVKLGWGQNVAGNTAYFQGKFDDWALFKRALTPLEIASLRTAGAPTAATVAHCISVGNELEGHMGFEVVRAPWVLRSIGGQAGTGPLGMDELATTPFSMAPNFVQSTFDYTVGVGPFTTGLRVAVSFIDPSSVGVFASFQDGASIPLANDVAALSAPFLLPVGASVLRLIVVDGTYSFTITRPAAVLQALTVQARTSWGAVEDFSAAMAPPFAAGVHRNYRVTVPYRAGLVRLTPTLNGPISVDLNGDVGGASPISATGEVTAWFNITQGAENVLRILSNDPTVNVTVTRLPPAVTAVSFSGMPAGTTVPPFVAGAAGARTISVKGVLAKLVMSVSFNSGSVFVAVNGVAAGSATSGVSMDLTPLLLSLDQDSTLVTLTTIDGVYRYTFQSGCPAPFQCWRTPSSDPLAGAECEFKCVFCAGAVIRRLCLQERPACCGTADVCTC